MKPMCQQWSSGAVEQLIRCCNSAQIPPSPIKEQCTGNNVSLMHSHGKLEFLEINRLSSFDFFQQVFLPL